MIDITKWDRETRPPRQRDRTMDYLKYSCGQMRERNQQRPEPWRPRLKWQDRPYPDWWNEKP